MKPPRHLVIAALALLPACFLAGQALAAPLIDDRAITIHSIREAAEKRQALIQYLWGRDGFPQR
ncbi:MAG: hypothetical protein Q7U75_19180, partial [Desulfobacterales bacterium]|nr:hypothetical protein [Desulfobacterales bacterium]